MALLSEKDICLELVEELLIHIKQMKIPGAVLIFLPGWSTIFALLRHLQQSRYASDYDAFSSRLPAARPKLYWPPTLPNLPLPSMMSFL